MVEEKIKALVEAKIVNAGYLLDRVEYKKEDGNYLLQIVIDREDGVITVDDCVNVSKIVNPIIDEEDPIEEQYILDVCSASKGE